MSKEQDTKIQELLPENLKDSLSSLHLDSLQEAFDAAVERKVREQVGVAVKSAEANFDAVVNERLERLVEKMEESNKLGLKKVYDNLNERATQMRESYEKQIKALKKQTQKALQEAHDEKKNATSRYLRERKLLSYAGQKKIDEAEQAGKNAMISLAKHFNGLLKEQREQAVKALAGMKRRNDNILLKEAKSFKKNLVESISNFLDREIDSKIPYEDVKKSLKNDTAMKLVESLKSMLAVDTVSSMEVIKAPINEARQIITESKKENVSLISENVKLRGIIDEKNRQLEQQINESNAKIEKAKNLIREAKRVAFLNEKLSTVPSLEQRQYIKNVMEGQTIDFMKENWDYVLKQYKNNRLQENAVLAEKAKSTRKSKPIQEVPQRRLIEATQRIREAKREEQEALMERSPRDRMIDDILQNTEF